MALNVGRAGHVLVTPNSRLSDCLSLDINYIIIYVMCMYYCISPFVSVQYLLSMEHSSVRLDNIFAYIDCVMSRFVTTM